MDTIVEGLTWYPPEWAPICRLFPGCVVAPPLDPASRIPWWCLSLARLRWGGVGWGLESLKFLGKTERILYTPENKHGIQKWRFWRWFSFSKRWFSGSMLISGVYTPEKEIWQWKNNLIWRCTVYSIISSVIFHCHASLLEGKSCAELII